MSLIPGFDTIKLVAIGIAVTAALSFAGYQVHQFGERRFAAGQAEVNGRWTTEREKQKDAAISEAASNAKETLRRLTRQKENQDALNKLTAQAAADRTRADAAGIELRGAAARYAAAARCPASNPTPVGLRPPAAADPGMLSIVLGLIDERAGKVAAYAGAARASGLKCESDYDALTPP